ncbi:ASCH domain-containing protein [Macrococcus animalis]|uniref:ASCH domain-containing protein n=1 Tax=Macrococcus animalis TaxID=3395467 RepID=UPI0039BE3E2B
MNNITKLFWDKYKEENGLANIDTSAWQFGADPDELARLVAEGKKTGTCSLHKLYEIDGELLPQVGQYDIILNKEDMPVAIIQTKKVEIEQMDKVSEVFAISEGEGDGTYQYWWDAHVEFFSEIVKEYEGITFDTSDKLVCETFEVVALYNDYR